MRYRLISSNLDSTVGLFSGGILYGWFRSVQELGCFYFGDVGNSDDDSRSIFDCPFRHNRLPAACIVAAALNTERYVDLRFIRWVTAQEVSLSLWHGDEQLKG